MGERTKPMPDNYLQAENSSRLPSNEMFISTETLEACRSIIIEAVETGLQFQLQPDVQQAAPTMHGMNGLLTPLPQEGAPLRDVLSVFKAEILPYCTNFSSPRFMGFPDAGNALAPIVGDVLSTFLQQNLIDQTIGSPSATFIDIAVIRWMREALGYTSPHQVADVWDVGGVFTAGGTASNALAMLLARERKNPDALEGGIRHPERMKLVVPEDIGHYSVKSSAMWLGCGNHSLEVPTDDYRYDLDELRRVLIRHRGEVMAVVAYACDSQTMTVDRLRDIATLTREIDPEVWLHLDACHGFSLAFSPRLREKLYGAELFDSIALDPHKVLSVPYAASMLLVKDPMSLQLIRIHSDLMAEDFSFGQATPFAGSREWNSLKVWFLLMHLGAQGVAHMVEERHNLAQYLHGRLSEADDFILLNNVDYNAVLFMHAPKGTETLAALNTLNQRIHATMLQEGRFYLHQFPISATPRFGPGATAFPLRFMPGNALTTRDDVNEMVRYVRALGLRMASQ